MSSIVNLDMCLIASSGLLPTEILHEVFFNTLRELNGTIQNNILSINNQRIGEITLKDRILVQTYSENVAYVNSQVRLLRETFTRRADVAIKNYAYELEQEKRRAIESNLASKELEARIKKTEELQLKQEKAIERQKLDSCEAIVMELKEPAENQGYDIIEEKTEEGIQLQFVRRIY